MCWQLQASQRLRPFVTIEVGRMFGAPEKALLRGAAAVECMHAYSLIHDDLPAMDDDDLRRGQPTVHIKWDEATAVLAGDGMQSFAFEMLCDPVIGDAAVRLELVQGLARAAGTSVRGLERAFDRDYGLSPRQYLRRLRMQTACQLLVSTRSPLAQVADRCGFADQSHFNRDFKRMTGMTPRAYRLKFVG
mgnify:CR=1 FL=1